MISIHFFIKQFQVMLDLEWFWLIQSKKLYSKFRVTKIFKICSIAIILYIPKAEEAITGLSVTLKPSKKTKMMIKPFMKKWSSLWEKKQNSVIIFWELWWLILLQAVQDLVSDADSLKNIEINLEENQISWA